MNHLLRKIQFSFCVNQTKFYAAEAVLKNFYGNMTNINRFQKKQKEIVPSHELVGKIIKDLRELQNKNSNMDKGVIDSIINMFMPTIGIPLEQFQSNFQNRQTQGKNKNNLFPLNPHFSVISQIMRELYEIDLKNKLNIKKTNGPLYILGSKGLSKSTSLMMIKYFHNLRIPYLISKSLESNQTLNSLFGINYKFFYFQADENVYITLQNLVNQLKKDFPGENLTKLLPNLGQLKGDIELQFWFSEIAQKYQKNKNIHVKAIIDQCNALYQQQNKQELSLKFWANMVKSFSKPTILVSSKNNNYLTNKDPIVTIAGKKQKIKKLILDNNISLEERVQYGADCFAFQMEKIGTQKEQIYKILKNIQQFPMSTHLACRQFLQKYKPQSEQKITNILQQKKNINQTDVKTLIQNLQQLSKISINENYKNYKNKKQQYDNSLDIIVKVCDFYKHFQTGQLDSKIKLSILSKNQENTQLNTLQNIIEKKLKVNYMLLNESQSNEKKLHFTNFFFVNKNIKTNQKIKSQYILYSCLTNQQIQRIISKLNEIASKQFFINLKPLIQYTKYKQFVDAFKGFKFQDKIDGIFLRYMSRQNLRLFIKRNQNDDIIKFRRESQLLPKFNNNERKKCWGKTVQQRQKSVKEISQKITSKNCCWRAAPYNCVFDFLITKFSDGVVNLFFIDASTKSSQQQKIDNFKTFLSNNIIFQQILNHISSQISTIIINFIVLRDNPSDTSKCSQKYSKQQIYAKFLKNQRKQDQQKVYSLKIQIMDYGNQFKIQRQLQGNNFQHVYDEILYIDTDITQAQLKSQPISDQKAQQLIQIVNRNQPKRGQKKTEAKK